MIFLHFFSSWLTGGFQAIIFSGKKKNPNLFFLDSLQNCLDTDKISAAQLNGFLKSTSAKAKNKTKKPSRVLYF